MANVFHFQHPDQSSHLKGEKRGHDIEMPWYQFLNEHGACLPCAPPLASDFEKLKTLYRVMVKTRLFDQKIIALQRTGQMGTYPSCLGQEAIGSAIGDAMAETDVFAPYYRDQATFMGRGITLAEMLQYWGGDERGCKHPDAAVEDLPPCVPIANQITHAAGIATAFKIRGQKRAVLTTCGDGATSRGDFYEAMNLAGVWQLPLVIVVNNNQWAISVRRDFQTAAETIAQKAIAAGIAGEQIDGNDIIAVHERVSEALAMAHAGKGATLIEAITYRLGDHTTADDATRYRPGEELRQAWQKCPIKRLQTYLHAQRAWDETQEQKLKAEIEKEIEQAVETYLSTPAAPATDMFDYLYETLPIALDEQRTHLLNKVHRDTTDPHQPGGDAQ